jgi:methyl-accepting chemotaxis protein
MPANLKFRHKILLAASLVVIGAFALFSLYNDLLQRSSIERNLKGYVAEMGAVTAGNIQSWLSGRILLVEAMAQSVARAPDNASVIGLLEQPAYQRTFLYSYLGTREGGFDMRPDDEMPADYDPRTRPWYQDAQRSGNSVLTEPYVDAATSQLVLTVATPVRQGGEVLGVVGGDLALDALVQTLNALDFAGMGYAFLVSSDGRILVHPDKRLLMKTLAEVYPGNTPALTPELSEVELNGQARLVAFTPIQGLPTVKWYVGLSIERDKAYAALREFRASALVATLLVRCACSSELFIEAFEAATTRRATSLTRVVAEDTSRIEAWMRSTKRLKACASSPNSSAAWIWMRRVRSPSPWAMSRMAAPSWVSGRISTRISTPSRHTISTTATSVATSAEARNSRSAA